jgi:hypothetical protein
VTKFLDKSFSSRPATKAYRDNFERTFSKKSQRCQCKIGCYAANKPCDSKAAVGNLCDWCEFMCQKEKP